jgi:hypothetical protein
VDSLPHAFWPRWYRLLRVIEPLILPIWRRVGIGNVVRLVVLGRRTGSERRVLLGVLSVAGRRYLGHPDVACPWTANLEAAGEGALEGRDGRLQPFRAVPLEPGVERDAVIRATFRQHPFPGNVCYWLSRGHIRRVGRFYRLEPLERRDPGTLREAKAGQR